MSILVIGGAGYIGSVVTKYLLDCDEDVVVLDNLTTGNIDAVDDRATFIYGDYTDPYYLDKAFTSKSDITDVVHLAAKSLVGESMTKPEDYYQNNVVGMKTLLDAMIEYNVSNIVFSSSAAVYGAYDYHHLTESTPCLPINPYGETKLAMERMMYWYSKAHRFNYIALRYFNAGGAWSGLGEDHEVETHVIPRFIKNHKEGKPVQVYGNEYLTKDGTCVRDYVHVYDLAVAHHKAVLYNRSKEPGNIGDSLNLGTYTGSSVLEVINQLSETSGTKVEYEVVPCREGDPARLVASNERAYNTIGWHPTKSLKDIIDDAWKWHATHPYGYNHMIVDRSDDSGISN